MLISFSTLLLFGSLTGVTTVLFGFGGGFVTVPARLRRPERLGASGSETPCVSR
ncbi:hypothetical protein ACRAWF_16630 [Streptomyces sp. L7]